MKKDRSSAEIGANALVTSRNMLCKLCLKSIAGGWLIHRPVKHERAMLARVDLP